MRKEWHGECCTIWCNSKEVAEFEGVPIKMISRYAKNDKKYVWLYPSQKKLNELVSKYGVDQIADGTIRKDDGTRELVECLWLNW